MGLETQCTLERDRRKVVGRALLESDHIAFRGRTQNARFLLSDVSHVEVDGDVLVLTHRDGAARLHLRAGMAATWMARIRNPRSLLDKLGVRAGMRVAVIGVDDPDFLRQLAERVGRYDAAAVPSTDVIVLGVDDVAELDVLASLRERLRKRAAAPSVSNAREGLLAGMAGRFEPVTEFSPGEHVAIETGGPPGETLRRARAALGLP